MAKLAEVVELYSSNHRDVIATLKVIIKNIEAGKYGAVHSAALVLDGDTVEVFGAGQECDGASIHLLLSAGALRLVTAAERKGKE
ncbi:hypothetical protein UFOVP1288_72 [uncultured Caudovirales phage]|uniref:Uncharacterized protein n=1 Tax=uncultured Caudovirales phage TaxID=2100421 RepID=A0A6J5RPP1_9CAUD|nr:hypothetical protein UFOVP1195_72 [uncultured Caudovirales phage]CAB4196267.1 hypothetical protein UFOVP1288_72 [uncultured Caudovirales phage]CAB4205202.1 hypothetical protein UFOVP1409_72 [uncultured Caudovirales phage]